MRRLTVGVAMGLLLTVVGCGSSHDRPSDPVVARPKSDVRTSGPVIAQTKASDYFNDALFHAALTERHGCLLLGDAIVVWPAGTTWDADRRQVVQHLPGKEAVRIPIGVVEDFSGGLVPVSKSSPEPVRSCAEATGVTQVVLAYL